MTAPLPRVYDEGPGGKAVPQAPAAGQPTNIGGDFRVEELLRISKETVRRLARLWIAAQAERTVLKLRWMCTACAVASRWVVTKFLCRGA